MSKTKPRRTPTRRYGRTSVNKTWYSDLPLLPIAVAALLIVGAIVAIVYVNVNKAPAGSGSAIDGILCEQNEQLAVHYHAHLSIIVAGNPAALSGQIGINTNQSCLYWLHTHATDGVIHIEAPKAAANRKFKLGELFDIWGQPLNATHVGATTLASGDKLTMFVDGKAYTGNPREIVLAAHTLVTIEVGTPVVPDPAFTFPAGE